MQQHDVLRDQPPERPLWHKEPKPLLTIVASRPWINLLVSLIVKRL